MQINDEDDDKRKSANERLRDYWILHAHYLERLAEREAQSVRRFLRNEVLPDLMQQLQTRLERIAASAVDRSIWKTQRLQKTLDAIADLVDEGIAVAKERSVESMLELADYEVRWQIGASQRALPSALELEFDRPAKSLLRELVRDRPIVGQTLEGWWDKLSLDTADRLQREVRTGLAEGQSIDEIARRIRGTAQLKGTDGAFEITMRQAQTITRTASITTSAAAREATFKANPDTYKRVYWDATLDTRTCKSCAALDRKTFAIGEGPRPALHPACRCTIGGVMKSWREMGLNIREFDESTRSSMDGQVPESMTYEEWLRRSSRARVEEALGPARAKLFINGELRLERMVDQSGRPLTLAQIAQREGIDLDS